jgi:hypothetical protein
MGCNSSTTKKQLHKEQPGSNNLDNAAIHEPKVIRPIGNNYDRSKIAIKTVSDEIYMIDYQKNMTVGELKMNLGNTIGLPIQNITLLYEGKSLAYSQTLHELNIDHKSTLLYRAKNGNKTINVVIVNKEHYQFEFITTAKIAELKEKIHQVANIPVESQVLTYKEIVLEDTKLFDDYPKLVVDHEVSIQCAEK